MSTTSSLRIPFLTILLPLLLAAPPARGQADAPPRLQLRKGDHVCLLGNALAERMQHDGWLEATLQLRHPDLELSFRNLGFSADEFTVQQRTAGFGTWDDYLGRCQADVILAFFGWNESFAGPEGIDAFKSHVSDFVDRMRSKKFGKSAPRLALCSPIPFEDYGDPNLPDAVLSNARIEPYVAAMAAVAQEKGVPFIDLYAPMQARYRADATPLTINGIHLTTAGNHVLAQIIDAACHPGAPALDARQHPQLLEIIREKNLRWFNRYRATDGYNVYGGRSHLKFTEGITNRTVLQREMEYLDAQCNNRDRRIWAVAQGKKPPTDDPTPELIRVKTNIRGKGAEGAHLYVDGEKAISLMTVAPGMQVELFACEQRFPELQNPVQMAWDTQGRLWVAVWPTYPHWEPDLPMNDKLLIFEDKDGDGRADVCKTFVDNLHNPTGFEFWNGGVYVAQGPDLLFLKDTDGDDRVDHRERVLHGLSSADTHHAANSFVFGPGGALYFQEGTFHQSQIESVYGPIRNHNGCVWRFHPRTWEVDRYVPHNFANPHGHVFDRWGQDFVTDGTGNRNYYALPFSGYIQHPAKHPGYFTFFQQPSRPSPGTEILSSSQFPEDNQGNYLNANVIGFRGIFQFKVHDDTSGFSATQVDSIVSSTDPSFRPSDLEVGPDGGLYFIDWYNPIIGHMQHHLRDPSRDHRHGRVYRVTCKGRPLQPLVKIAGQPISALLDVLKHPVDRVRYRARIELSGRTSDAVVSAAATWVTKLDPEDPNYEHQLLEALWLHQQHNRMDLTLLDRLLAAKDFRARSAAARVVRYMRHQIPDAIARLKRSAGDPHPRVRLEAVVAASHFDRPEAVAVAMESKRYPSDRFIDYALKETMRALDPVWKAAIQRGELVAADNPEAVRYMLNLVNDKELLALPRISPVLKAILTRHGVDAGARKDAAEALAKEQGKTPVNVLIDTLRHLDGMGGHGGHARHVIHQLGKILLPMVTPPVRSSLLELARTSRMVEARQVACAALISMDGQIAPTWSFAQKSRAGLLAFLGAIPMVPDAEVRSSAYEIVRPLMFEVPATLRTGGASARVPGLRVSFYRGTPANAKMETFRKLQAETSGHVANFSLGIPQILQRDQFGLLFEGTVHIPREGRYVFFTKSDDGSRLYIDQRAVVNNDGPHGMVEKKGAIRLAAGPHRIAVTYYDQGGADGLVVSWRGPGFKKQPIPGNVLSTGETDAVRVSAIRAIAHIPGNEGEKFQDAARLIGEGTLIESAVYLVEKTPEARWPKKNVAPVVDAIAAFASALPPTQRTSPRVVAALQAGKTLAKALPDDEATSLRQRLAGLGGSTILIRTVPHEMLYDRREFSVEAGKPVAIVFQNNDVMPHNLVITQPGALKRVGVAAEAIQVGPESASPNFIPETPDVLWHTELLLPGATTRLSFVAPAQPVDLPYVCTFPGHWRVMNGVMHVVEKLEPTVATVPTEVGTAPARRFVKLWTLDALAPKLTEGWEKGRTLRDGKLAFGAAGCNKCHWFRDEGIKSAPDLSKTHEKYTAEEMLRHIIEPSASILEGYDSWLIETSEGDLLNGRILKEDGDSIHVSTDLKNPKAITIVPKGQIESRTKMSSSMMPTGLLVTFTEKEILDLLAYMRSGK